MIATDAEDGRGGEIVIDELSVLHDPQRVVFIGTVHVGNDGYGHQAGAGQLAAVYGYPRRPNT